MAPRFAAAAGLVLAAALIVPATAATPKAGSWSGETKQNRDVSFKVTPGGEKVKQLKVGFKGTCDNGATFTGNTSFGGKYEVNDGQFTADGGNTTLRGEFTSKRKAEGTLKHNARNFDPISLGYTTCRSGKVRWTAHR